MNYRILYVSANLFTEIEYIKITFRKINIFREMKMLISWITNAASTRTIVRDVL